MIRPNTDSHAAEVIHVQAIWNRAYQQFVGITMWKAVFFPIVIPTISRLF